MELITRLRGIVIPEAKRLTKKTLLEFYESARILERMAIFYNGDSRGGRRVPSRVNVEEEESFPHTLSDLSKMKATKIRKLLRDFQADLGLKRKHSKMSKNQLSALVRRNRLEEVLAVDNGEKDRVLDAIEEEEKEPEEKKEEPEEKKEPEKKPAEEKEVEKPPSDEHMIQVVKERMDKVVEKTQPVEVTVNTAESSIVATACPDDPEENLLKTISPHLFKTLQQKSALLDMCEMTEAAEGSKQPPWWMLLMLMNRGGQSTTGPAGPAGEHGRDGRDGTQGRPGRDGGPGQPGRDLIGPGGGGRWDGGTVGWGGGGGGGPGGGGGGGGPGGRMGGGRRGGPLEDMGGRQGPGPQGGDPQEGDPQGQGPSDDPVRQKQMYVDQLNKLDAEIEELKTYLNPTAGLSEEQLSRLQRQLEKLSDRRDNLDEIIYSFANPDDPKRDVKKQMEDFNEELELAKHDNARMRAELEHERAEVQRDRAFLEEDAKRVQRMKADTMFTKDKQQYDMRVNESNREQLNQRVYHIQTQQETLKRWNAQNEQRAEDMNEQMEGMKLIASELARRKHLVQVKTQEAKEATEQARRAGAETEMERATLAQKASELAQAQEEFQRNSQQLVARERKMERQMTIWKIEDSRHAQALGSRDIVIGDKDKIIASLRQQLETKGQGRTGRPSTPPRKGKARVSGDPYRVTQGGYAMRDKARSGGVLHENADGTQEWIFPGDSRYHLRHRQSRRQRRPETGASEQFHFRDESTPEEMRNPAIERGDRPYGQVRNPAITRGPRGQGHVVHQAIERGTRAHGEVVYQAIESGRPYFDVDAQEIRSLPGPVGTERGTVVSRHVRHQALVSGLFTPPRTPPRVPATPLDRPDVLVLDPATETDVYALPITSSSAVTTIPPRDVGMGLTAVKSRLKRKAPRRRRKKKEVVVPVEKKTKTKEPEGLDQRAFIV